MKLLEKIQLNGLASYSTLQFDNDERLPLLMDTKSPRQTDESEIRIVAKSSKFNEYFVSIIANIVGLAWGAAIGWSSPSIAKMTNGDSPLDFIPTAEEFSWIGSILPLGGVFGAILCAPLPSGIGRKNCLLLSAVFFAVSFALLMFTSDLPSIYTARFFQGVGSSLVMVVLPIYIGEIASPECRGILSSFIQIGLVVGILYAYSIGPYVSYFTFQLFCLLIPISFVMVFAFMPDTPHFYIAQNDRARAASALRYLRSYSCDITAELDEIERDVRESLNHSNGLLAIFKGRANLIAHSIGVGLICFQNSSGIDAILFYSETIFMKASSSIDSAVATIIIGMVMLASSFITPCFVDRTGRKGLLIVSAAGMTFSCTILGVYFYLDEREAAGALGWLPVTSLVTFIIFYCMGFGPLPFTVLSEMFSPETKSVSTSLAVMACWIVDFIVTKCFLPLESVIGNYGNFWLFGGFSLVAMVFSCTVVFETKGLTLSEIQGRLNGQRKNEVLK